MSLEKEISVETENYSKYKKLRNFFYIATGATGLSMISVPYVYQTLNKIYDSETAAAGLIIEGLIVGGIAVANNVLYKTYREKMKESSRKIKRLTTNHNNNI